MRFSTLAIIAASSSLAAAQGDVLSQLPQCGRDCFGNNFAGCEQLNFACICGNERLISELSCCVATNCDTAEEESIIGLASGLCQAYGVQVPTQASCASSASSTAASTASSGSTSPSSSSGSSETTSAPSTATTGEASETTGSAANAETSGASGAAGPIATAHAGLGLAVGVVGLLAGL